MSAVVLAMFAAVGFSGASLLALLGGQMSARGRSYAAAFAAGILLALAFADLFPESLELGGTLAIMGFVAGFVLLFLTEVLTSAHTHHSPDQALHKHALGPFVVGLAIHNFADGFVLGVSAKAAAVTSWLVGIGVLVHQVPVGISLAAVFVVAHATGTAILRTAALLGLAIPIAAGLTVALPVPGDWLLGFLTGIAGGVLAYIGSAHLLPEAQAEHSNKTVGILFATTFVVTAFGLLAVRGG
jgi:zinc transporter ZupT